jgi:hypothetical protein
MDLAALWREQQLAPFPAGERDRQVDGESLLKLDAAVGAILTASLRRDGIPRPLDPARRADLASRLPLLETAAAGLPAGEARRYAERLVILSRAVLSA